MALVSRTIYQVEIKKGLPIVSSKELHDDGKFRNGHTRFPAASAPLSEVLDELIPFLRADLYLDTPWDDCLISKVTINEEKGTVTLTGELDTDENAVKLKSRPIQLYPKDSPLPSPIAPLLDSLTEAALNLIDDLENTPAADMLKDLPLLVELSERREVRSLADRCMEMELAIAAGDKE